MIGERLKRLRAQKGLSVRQLSRLAHVPHETISRLENDVQRSPSLPVAMRLAKTLGVSLDYLAGMDELYGAESDEQESERPPASTALVGAESRAGSAVLRAEHAGEYSIEPLEVRRPTPAMSRC